MLTPEDDPLRSASASPEHPHPPAPHSSRSPLSSRGPSLDLSASSLRSNSLDSRNDRYRGRSSFESNPFRDPSLDWVSPPSSSIHHPRSRDASMDSGGGSLSPSVASSIHSPEDLERELADAVSLELPRVSEESSRDGDEDRRRDRSGTVTASTSSKDVRRGSEGEGSGSSSAKRGSLLYQFRTGSGWFAPLVPPTPPPTREARQQAEKERIERLKEGKSASRRPGLMKRMSSGVEMTFGSSSAASRARSGSGVSLSGFGGGGSGSGLGGRERSGSSATIVPK